MTVLPQKPPASRLVAHLGDQPRGRARGELPAGGSGRKVGPTATTTAPTGSLAVDQFDVEAGVPPRDGRDAPAIDIETPDPRTRAPVAPMNCLTAMSAFVCRQRFHSLRSY